MHVVTPSDTRGHEHEGYRVPAPQAPMTQHWVPAGKTIKFAGVDLPGPLYFGRPVEGMESEPSSIDPTLPIAAVGDFFRVARSLWASYKTLAMHERRGYVDWLATGRSHPDVDMRLVFMYFYGLERRLVVDLPKDQSILGELPAIEAELLRLRDTYEQREKSFATAVDSLLHWVKQPGAPKALYAKKDVEFRRVHGLRVYTEVAVGQAVHARQPIQARMALTWAFESATVYLPAECKPLRPQFEALFEELFAAVHPSGMHINSPPARYELHYRAASPALTGHPATSVRLADAADTKLLEDPLQQIKAIFKAAQTEIERYAKIVARGGGVPQVKLEELQSLPMRLWPEHSKASLRGLVKRVSEGSVIMTAAEVLAAIHPETKFAKASAQIALSILQNMGLSTTPPLVGESRAVKPETLVALLPSDLLDDEQLAPEAHTQAVRALQCATSIVAAGGQLPGDWKAWIDSQVDKWGDGLSGCALLRARAWLIAADPPPLAALKKVVEGVGHEEAESIRQLSTRAACAFGEPSGALIKALQKLYQALGLDAKRVPGDVHVAASGQEPAPGGGFQLDDKRIAELQQDTQRVADVLSAIFSAEEEVQPAPAPAPALVPADLDSLMGLDAKHTKLARQLLAQPQWTREQLLQAAAGAGLMPDGALERINDACFDLHDMPFSEGEDPIDINPDILEILS